MNWRSFRTIDWSLYIVPLFLMAFGVTILFSFAFTGQKNLAVAQIVYSAVGIAAMLVLSFLDYRVLKGVAWYLYLATIILLVLILFFGTQSFGARRWLDLGVFQLQASELMKVVLVLLVARMVTAWRELSWGNVVVLGLVIVLPLLLVLRQPDLGTTSVLAVVMATMIAHVKVPKHFWKIVLAVALVAAPLAWSQLRPYQKQRIETFLNPGADTSGTGYNVAQSKIAIGSGGIWGRGLGQGSQSQLNFLPVAHTDFIFAAIAEATGFIGSVVVLLLFATLIWRTLNAATQSQDEYGRYVALGIAAMFLFQSVVNIGSNMGLLPATGIPLPFVSFGGSGVVTNFLAIGILQSIYIRHKKIRFG